MIFSESDSDTVTFNAHEHKYNEMASHGASSSPSSIPFNSLEVDESTASSQHAHPQKVEITIDSVAPYETSSTVVDSRDDDDDDAAAAVVEEDMQSSNRVGNMEESEMNTNDSQDQRNQEKRTKNDEL